MIHTFGKRLRRIQILRAYLSFPPRFQLEDFYAWNRSHGINCYFPYNPASFVKRDNEKTSGIRRFASDGHNMFSSTNVFESKALFALAGVPARLCRQ